MKRIGISIITVLIFGLNWLNAADPIDNQVKGALIDIERYEKQFLNQSTANKATINRSLKLLGLTRQRLDSSPNKSHASWIEADGRYKLLIAHLNSLLNPSSSASSAPPSSASSVPSQASSSKSVSSRAAQPMISQYRVRIKKILRDINSRFDTMDSAGVKPFQDPEYVSKWESSAQRSRESIEKYDDFKSDPDVVAASEALAKLNNMINFGKQHAAKELAELGDVQARLAIINGEIRQLSRPVTPQEPFKEGELRQWLVQLATIRKAAVDIYTPLPEIKQRAYLPDNRFTVEQGGAFDLQDVDRLERSLIESVNTIDSNLKSFGEGLTRLVENTKIGLAHYSECDPADKFDQTNHFLSEGRADEVRAQLTKDLQNVSESVQFAKLTKKEELDQYMAILNEVQSTIELYETNYQHALELVRMPKAASTDAKLRSTAERTLASYDYIGEIKRLVINTEKAHRTEETSSQEIDDIDVSLSGTVTLKGTETTYFYEWDQFQVATAEPMGQKYYIFYTTLKYYTSGDSTTPLNKWIISGRIQGSEIPENNISK